MATRHLYLARHGAADPFGALTDDGRRQAGLLGARLTRVPVDVVWHSPLARAADSAHELARHLPGVPVAAADELADHVPYVPAPAETPPAWAGFFDGYDAAEAAVGHRLAQALVTRFAAAPPDGDTHEVLVTHAYPIAWLVRHVLAAPPARWLGLDSANTGLTLVECRTGLPPTLVLFNDLGHLPDELRWTGFRGVVRP
ncbi:histidine phosphatase family protein [Jiangella endophytica]|uniref:histidine phosphatase family protein n=1 Tax=Jiangella endophytica TaxID=1623398 RepID=UPI000E34ADB5|nr:histidine phosphatase family protein [Jiangella endophytica]